MISESVLFISYRIREPVPSHFFPKLTRKFLKFGHITYGSILATDAKNLDHVHFVTPQVRFFFIVVVLMGRFRTRIKAYFCLRVVVLKAIFFKLVVLNELLLRVVVLVGFRWSFLFFRVVVLQGCLGGLFLFRVVMLKGHFVGWWCCWRCWRWLLRITLQSGKIESTEWC